MRVLACPGCGVKIKIPDGKAGRFNCPKCGKALLIKTPGDAADPTSGRPAPVGNPPQQRTPTSQPDPLQLPPSQTLPSSFPVLPTGAGYAPRGQTAMPGATQRPAATARATPLKGFLRPLGIGLGILSVVLLLIGGLGLISEPIALAACFLGIGSAVGLAAWGRIWMLVLAFQESVAQGLLVLLVPYYWIAFGATRKGTALRPLVLMISAMVPILISLAMLAVFLPKYQGGMRFPVAGSRKSSYSRAKLARIEEQIRESHNTSPQADVLRSVSFPTFSQIGGTVDLAKAEQVLAELPGYVPGTFRFDAPGRTVAFQYRGTEEMARRYALVLAAKANVVMSFTPTFGDGAFLQKESVVATNRPASGPSITTPPVPSIDLAAAVANDTNPLRTVSFQTLAQGDIAPATAEQALTQVKGYVAGSFRFDQQKQLITLQYHGAESAAMPFGFALQQKLQIVVRLRPIFAEEP